MPTTNVTQEVARRFSQALDCDDFDLAATFLETNCVYHTGHTELRGPQAIIASYRESSDWGRNNLDEIAYESSVEYCDGEQATILFIDHLESGSLGHEFRCQQRIFVSTTGKIHRIQQVEIEGQRDRLNRFFETSGLKRSAPTTNEG